MLKSTLAFLLAIPLILATQNLAVAQIDVSKVEIGDVVEVKYEDVWFPGVILSRQLGPAFRIRFYDRKSGVKSDNFFFPPEMRELPGKGFEPEVAELRSWSSTRGTTANARLLISDGANVLLKRENGKVVSVPIELLTAADKEYLKAQYESRLSKTKPAQPPTATEIPETTPFEDLLGMGKDEFLAKLKADQDKLLRNYSDDDDGSDKKTDEDQGSGAKDADTEALRELLGNMDKVKSEDGLSELKEKLEKMGTGAGSNPDSQTDAPPAQLPTTPLRDGQYQFSLAIPGGFEPFEDPNAAFTVLHSFKQTNSNQAMASVIEIHRLDLTLDAAEKSQIRKLESQIGIPSSKSVVTVNGAPLEIWHSEPSSVENGSRFAYTLLVPIEPDAIRISIAGPQTAAQDNLLRTQKIAESLDIDRSVYSPRGYRTEFAEGISPDSSGNQTSTAAMELRKARRATRSASRNFRNSKTWKISLFALAGGALAFCLFRIFNNTGQEN